MRTLVSMLLHPHTLQSPMLFFCEEISTIIIIIIHRPQKRKARPYAVVQDKSLSSAVGQESCE